MPRVRDLWFKLLVVWYRLIGNTPVQADWRARRAMQAPGEARDAVKAHTDRARDRRFNCVCGQLLVEDDRVCHACGRRQLLPYWARSALRMLGVRSTATTGTWLVGFLMAVGYVIQIRHGDGGFLSPSGGVLESLDLGAAFGWLTLGPQPWRAFTYTCLHGGLWHIGFNLLALGIIGPIVERRFGTARFLFWWVVGGGLAVVIPPLLGFLAIAPVVGASGSVSALIGMAFLHGHLEGTSQGRAVRNQMFTWMVYTTVFGLFVGAAHSAHFAGFAVGAAGAWLLPPPDRDPLRKRLSFPLGLVALLYIALAIGAWGTWFATGGTPPKAVRSGAPTPPWWYAEVADARGPEAAFGPEAAALIREAETSDTPPNSEQVARLLRIATKMGHWERAAFAERLPAAWR